MKKIKLLHIFCVIYICLLNYSGMFCMDSGYGESAYARMPKEIMHTIFFQDIKSSISVEKLTEGVKGLIQFRSTCKEIYSLLPDQKISELCKNCNVGDKDKLLEEILKEMTFYRDYEFGQGLALIYSGVDPNIGQDGSLLRRAVIDRNDFGVTKILLEFGANSNQMVSCLGPIIFGAQSVAIADLLKAKGANMYSEHKDKNILEECLNQNYPSDLMEFYIKKCKVDVKRKDGKGNSLWHALVFASVNFDVEKAQLLFQKIPTLINQKNKKGQTPLDCYQNCYLTEEYIVLILRNYGAKTSKELEEEERAKINA